MGQFDCDEGELGPTWCHQGAHQSTCTQHHWECPAESERLLSEIYAAVEVSDFEAVARLARRAERVSLRDRGIVELMNCHGGILARVEIEGGIWER